MGLSKESGSVNPDRKFTFYDGEVYLDGVVVAAHVVPAHSVVEFCAQVGLRTPLVERVYFDTAGERLKKEIQS